MKKPCPCGSNLEYTSCCESIVNNHELAKSAEQLMRARYSAYANHDVDFIEKTHHPSGNEDFNKKEALEWAKSSNWKKLEIVSTDKGQEGDSQGKVEFKAHYELDGTEFIHHERSDFVHEDNKWYFLNGEIVNQPLRRESLKVGRNEPCPCGSGKKFKKCCG